jgi:hypothetical protein
MIPAQDLVFLDESGVNLSMVRGCARSIRGNRVYGAKPSRTKNVSVVGAISLKKGLLSQWSTLGYMDALTLTPLFPRNYFPNCGQELSW